MPTTISPIAQYLNQRFSPTDNPIFQQTFTAVTDALEKGDTVLNHSHLSPIASLIVSVEQAKAGIVAPLVYDGQRVWLYRIWQSERQLAQQLTQRHRAPFIAYQVELTPYLEGLKPEQQQAVEYAVHHHLTLINGGPGTGKTYTVSRIVRALLAENPAIRIALAAPTGKAAKRMEESLHHALQTVQDMNMSIIKEAQTLHRLLGIGKRHQPQYDHTNPLPYDLIIIDEASMLSVELARYLFDASPPHARLILLGDADQLAAVEPGAVLHDISHHPNLADSVITLRESKRFSSASGIGRLASLSLVERQITETELATLIRQTTDIHCKEISPDLYQQLIEPYQSYFHYVKALDNINSEQVSECFALFDRYRILTAGHHGAFGRIEINRHIRRAHCWAMGYPTEQPVYHGEPLMITANDYHNGLFNGDIGIVLYHQEQYQLYFPHREQPLPLSSLNSAHMETAYALTIHKAQGSEYDRVALCLEPKQTQGLTRELLYTGITRAKRQLDIYASHALLVQIMQSPTYRSTGLSTFL